jgi:hypothetical protein
MKRLLALYFLRLAFALPDFSQHKTTPRPHCGGGHHTEPHGGTYPAGHGSSDKGCSVPICGCADYGTACQLGPYDRWARHLQRLWYRLLLMAGKVPLKQ